MRPSFIASLVIGLLSPALSLSLYKQHDDDDGMYNNSTTGGNNDDAFGRCGSEGCVSVAGFVLQNIDQDTYQCRDFYAYACGKFLSDTWINKLSMLPSPIRIFDSFDQRVDIVIDKVLQPLTPSSAFSSDYPYDNSSSSSSLVDYNSNDDNRKSADKKAADFFSACTLSPQTVDDARSLKFVRNVLASVGGLYVTTTRSFDIIQQHKNLWSIEEAMVQVLPFLTSTGIFSMSVARDDFNASRYALFILPADTPATLLLEHPLGLHLVRSNRRKSSIHRLHKHFLELKRHRSAFQAMDSQEAAFISFVRGIASLILPKMSIGKIDESALRAIAEFQSALTDLAINATAEVAATSTSSMSTLYRVTSVRQLYRLCPFMDWKRIATRLGAIYKVDALSRSAAEDFKNLAIYTTSPQYLSGVCRLLKATMNRRQGDGPAIIQSYLGVQALLPYFVDLSDNFRAPFEEFVNGLLISIIRSQQFASFFYNNNQQAYLFFKHMANHYQNTSEDGRRGKVITFLKRANSNNNNNYDNNNEDKNKRTTTTPRPQSNSGDDDRQALQYDEAVRCRTLATDLFGLVISRRFVEQYFTRQAKREATEMAENIREELLANFDNADWMDPATKQNAKKKAETILLQIGYEDRLMDDNDGGFGDTTDQRWLDSHFNDLDITNTDHLVNLISVARHATKEELSRLDQVPDRNEWSMQAFENNAEYDFNENAIHVTAAAANEPFFRPDYPLAWNYGSLGYTIGHELTHSIDSSGSLYDENGQLDNWWTNATLLEFRQRSQCFLDQYSSMSTPIPGQHVCGRQTLDENIADNGGIKLAYNAFLKKVGVDELKKPAVPGLTVTNEQLFFISVAQGYCEVRTDDSLLQQLALDEHPPNNMRVQAMMMNFKPWSAAFNCPSSSPMNPVKKCQVW